MIRRFNPTSEHPARAVQAWEILVSKAMNRQTVTYELLSALMYGKKAQGVLNAVLGHVAFYCEDNGLPPLLYLSLENGLENLEKVSLLTPPKLTKIVSRSEEHTSELQSRLHLVCRLLLEKKKRV